MSGAWPEPTDDELATLTLHVTEWGSRTKLQQSVCLAILRRHCYIRDIARYLQIGEHDIGSALTDLIGNGLLWDHQRLLLR